MVFPVLFYIHYKMLVGFEYSCVFLTGYSILFYYNIIILETLSYAREYKSLSTLQSITYTFNNFKIKNLKR